MNQLFELHKKYGSVKVRDKYPYSHEYVTKIYPRYLHPLRDVPCSILEIGIAYGGALKAMRDYLTKAKIVGYDIKMDNIDYSNMERITLVQGDQADEIMLTKIAKEHEPFDIIIDDACHLYEPQLKSLTTLWPFVKSGGFYIIEDVMKLKGKNGTAHNEIFNYIKQELLTVDAFAMKHHTGDIACIAFHNTLICLEKK